MPENWEETLLNQQWEYKQCEFDPESNKLTFLNGLDNGREVEFTLNAVSENDVKEAVRTNPRVQNALLALGEPLELLRAWDPQIRWQVTNLDGLPEDAECILLIVRTNLFQHAVALVKLEECIVISSDGTLHTHMVMAAQTFCAQMRAMGECKIYVFKGIKE